MKDTIDKLLENTEEKYLYTRHLAKYAELKQDMYLWVLQESKLKDYYVDESENYVNYATKFVVEGKKLDRAELPQLNLILQTLQIGYWANSSNNENENYNYIRFNFPSDIENRKFNLKIGKVTDNAILMKIKNNDYTGITDLASYAKNNSAVYSKQLTTTDKAYYYSKDTLFDGRSLLENKAYYYIYVEFDDENGKYYPIEGVTLGQAWHSSVSNSWDLWAYTSSDFKWDNLTYAPTENKPSDSTIVPGTLPYTGINIFIMTISTVTLSIIGIVFYKKYSTYKGIN